MILWFQCWSKSTAATESCEFVPIMAFFSPASCRPPTMSSMEMQGTPTCLSGGGEWTSVNFHSSVNTTWKIFTWFTLVHTLWSAWLQFSLAQSWLAPTEAGQLETCTFVLQGGHNMPQHLTRLSVFPLPTRGPVLIFLCQFDGCDGWYTQPKVGPLVRLSGLDASLADRSGSA